MSNQDFIHHAKLDINQVRISPTARQSKTSPAKRIYVNYGKKKLVFQTPKMKIPMGVSEFDPSKQAEGGSTNGPVKRYFEPQLDEFPKLKQFFHDFEMAVFKSAVDNCEKWLGKKKISPDPDFMDSAMSLVVRKNVSKKDGTVYPDTVRFKLVEKWENGKPCTDEYDVKVYDKNGNSITLDEIGAGGQARFIVSCTGLTAVGGKVHPGWKVEQVRFYPGSMSVNLPENAFLSSDDEGDDDEDDEPKMNKLKDNLKDNLKVAAPQESEQEVEADDDGLEEAAAELESSDEEEDGSESESEEEAPPARAPAPNKRGPAKKK